MTPYSATDLVRAMRQTHGFSEDVAGSPAAPSRIRRWLAAKFHQA